MTIAKLLFSRDANITVVQDGKVLHASAFQSYTLAVVAEFDDGSAKTRMLAPGLLAGEFDPDDPDFRQEVEAKMLAQDVPHFIEPQPEDAL